MVKEMQQLILGPGAAVWWVTEPDTGKIDNQAQHSQVDHLSDPLELLSSKP
jgi:hypothetical protein